MPVEKVLDNLLVSEQVYYNDLQGLIQNVAVPLQNAKVLSQEVSDVLFGSLPDMLDSSQLFIKELTRIKDDLWGDSGIGYIVMGLTSCISKTYSEFIEKIPLRWQYCHILRQQSAMLEHIQHKEDADEGNNNDNWPDLLLESPVSRILDYLQLFKGFIQFANEQETHSEMITSAVGQLDQIIKRILEVQQQLKRWKDVVALANCIDISNFHVKVTDFESCLLPPELAMTTRVIARNRFEAILSEQSPGLQLDVILLTHALIICEIYDETSSNSDYSLGLLMPPLEHHEYLLKRCPESGSEKKMLLKLVDQPEVALNILDEDSVNNWIRMSSVARYEVSHHLEDKTANNDQAIPPKVITLTATTLDSDNEAYERIIAKNDAGLTDELPRFVVYSRVGGCILGVWIQDAWEIQTEVCQLELRYYPDGGFCIAALTEVDQALITEAAINQDNEISRTSPFEIDFDSSDATYRCMFADEESANHFYIQLERVSQLEVQRTKTAVTPMKPNDEPPTIITNDDDNSDSNSNKGSASDLSESGDSGFASSSSALAETDTEEFDFPTTPQSKEEVVPALVVSRRASTLNTSSFTTPVSALPRTSSLDPKGGCYISHIRRKEGDRFTHKRAASMPVETSSVLLAPPQMSKPNRVSLEVASILGGRRTLLYTPCKIYLLTDHTSWTFLGKTMLEVSTNLKNSTQIQIKASGLKKGRKPFELNILSPLATVELAQKRINLTVLGEDKLSSVYCIRIKDPENLALAYKLLSLYAEKSNAK